MSNDRLINLATLQKDFGLAVSRETLRRHCKAGRFPKPVVLGRRVFWKISDINAFLENRPVSPAHQAAPARPSKPSRRRAA